MLTKARLQRVQRITAFAGGLVVAALAVALRVLGALLIVVLAGLEWALPRLARATGPFRKRLRKKLRRAWRKTRLTPLRTAVTMAVLSLIGLNGVIRLTGGSPGWLSSSHLTDKISAVSQLALHLPFHAFGSCGESKEVLMREAAREHRIPLALVRAVAKTESGFRSHVISHAGAMGVMQLMPATARAMEVRDPFDAQESIRGGARYLGELYRRYGADLERTAAAYHAGPGAVPVRGRLRVGPATRRYMRVVVRRTAESEPRI